MPRRQPWAVDERPCAFSDGFGRGFPPSPSAAPPGPGCGRVPATFTVEYVGRAGRRSPSRKRDRARAACSSRARRNTLKHVFVAALVAGAWSAPWLLGARFARPGRPRPLISTPAATLGRANHRAWAAPAAWHSWGRARSTTTAVTWAPKHLGIWSTAEPSPRRPPCAASTSPLSTPTVRRCSFGFPGIAFAGGGSGGLDRPAGPIPRAPSLSNPAFLPATTHHGLLRWRGTETAVQHLARKKSGSGHEHRGSQYGGPLPDRASVPRKSWANVLQPADPGNSRPC
jgi:hypothetical protein